MEENGLGTGQVFYLQLGLSERIRGVWPPAAELGQQGNVEGAAGQDG